MVKYLALISMILTASAGAVHPPTVRPGADLLLARHLQMLQGKRVGMIVNHTSRLMTGEFLVDTLRSAGVQVTALFGPEHGVRGAAGAGEKVTDGIDEKSGVPVYSLYGERNKPTADMLKHVDLLIYDIQDVGARFYTYISTLKLCMDAAAEYHIPFIVLDRPNPLGDLSDGPLLEDSMRSFVGIGPLPVVYGMTCGELATFMNGAGWLEGGQKANLTVIWMDGWHRGMLWQETGLPWLAPSPNIPTPETAEIYPSTCFLEATNVSEGRGTPTPFFVLGAPFLNADRLSAALNARALPGIRFAPETFTPVSSKHKNVVCAGVRAAITDRTRFRPVQTGLAILAELIHQQPDSVALNGRWLGKLLGKGNVAAFLKEGGDPATLEPAWAAEREGFAREREKFLHHPYR